MKMTEKPVLLRMMNSGKSLIKLLFNLKLLFCLVIIFLYHIPSYKILVPNVCVCLLISNPLNNIRFHIHIFYLSNEHNLYIYRGFLLNIAHRRLSFTFNFTNGCITNLRPYCIFHFTSIFII